MALPFSMPANVPVALGAAATWGAGDFSGGMGVKATGGSVRGALRVVLLAHGISFLVLTAIVVLRHDAIPHSRLLSWALLAGFSTGLSLTAFYMALSRGLMGASAAISGLLAAAIPAIVSTFVEGAPGNLRLAGFALAFVAIWVIAADTSGSGTNFKSTLALSIFGGIGFGITFVSLRMASPLGLVMPMALARAASFVTCGVLLLGLRLFQRSEDLGKFKLSRTALLWVLGVAAFDTGGNLFFTAATRLGRLDVAAVLASLYPASTILLAAWRLRERPTRRQLAGMAVALAAVVLISR